ncbi:bis(5'-nucleosyl)-tetraphosphatase, symmetrical [Marinobacterium nitratireducens]|uniref:Bis(5'-nucleosyl)-tetraphosphatase, symmetrical n=1 Tax=Marinobacterium nitratireducens TaxID=518897 RepID=A0A918DVR2_9GAMM|nr:symmetrical bis(5'-nucleosyl)-tetraphosphatase [Marinobacterium nitratireducens]GGO86404.1 bis(5'-nucleosyl)-tetraphosphatase, symmetrical [Marinobacterium nitratireducens]
MATYAIGDIQGCYDQLQELLDQIGFCDSDRLWLAGDLVNRGPKSLETLRFVKSLGDRAQVVLGNHDLHLLAIHYGVTRPRRSDTLNEILEAPDRDELMHWLRLQPLLVHDPELDYVMVHAGIPPAWSLKKACKRAQEVEQVLRSTLAREFFQQMYGNEPDHWYPGLEGWARLRVITNYLTRMRFCDDNGRLDFSAKGGLETQPPGFRPWYAHKRRADEARIIFGHWAALEGGASDHRLFSLDTGCVWGNRLTAMRLEDQAFFSCDCSCNRREDSSIS